MKLDKELENILKQKGYKKVECPKEKKERKRKKERKIRSVRRFLG